MLFPQWYPSPSPPEASPSSLPAAQPEGRGQQQGGTFTGFCVPCRLEKERRAGTKAMTFLGRGLRGLSFTPCPPSPIGLFAQSGGHPGQAGLGSQTARGTSVS